MTSDRLDTITNSALDDRAVSPVVGVALLIAITVILAAVIGFVVLDSTVSTTETPNAKVVFQGEDPTLVQHEGGSALNGENVYITINRDRETIFEGSYQENWEDDDGVFDTGDEFEIENTQKGDRILIYWDDPESDREVPIGETTIQ